MKKILYFTAGKIATSAEVAAIATLNTIASDPYEVTVMSGLPNATLTGIKLSAAAADNSYNDAGATITAGTISAAAADNSINDSGNGFITAGFQANDVLTISGFTGTTGNNTAGTAIAVSVTAAKIVLSGVTLVNDSAGESVTVAAAGRFLQRGFKVGQHIMVRGFTGTAANNISDGEITSLTATKMIIGGTAGDVIVNDAAGESVTICTVNTDATYGGTLVVADYLAGTIPEQYKSSGSPVYTEFSLSAPPRPDTLIATQAVVTSGDVIALDTDGDVTVTVAAGAITAADVASTEAVITHADTVAVTSAAGVASDDGTAAVVAHALTVALPGTKTVVENGDTAPVGGVSATFTVTDGVLTAGSFGATRKVLTTSAEIPITSGTGTTKVTLTIAGGEITACVLS